MGFLNAINVIYSIRLDYPVIIAVPIAIVFSSLLLLLFALVSITRYRMLTVNSCIWKKVYKATTVDMNDSTRRIKTENEMDRKKNWSFDSGFHKDFCGLRWEQWVECDTSTARIEL